MPNFPASLCWDFPVSTLASVRIINSKGSFSRSLYVEATCQARCVLANFTLQRYPEQARLPVAFVPARCPVRGNMHSELSEDERPVGRAGWHRACPYTRRNAADYQVKVWRQ